MGKMERSDSKPVFGWKKLEAGFFSFTGGEMGKNVLIALLLTFFGLSSGRGVWAADVNWASIVPELEGATYVKDTTECEECHEEYMATYGNTVHGRIFRLNLKNDKDAIDCENCHGPMSKHLDAPRKKPPLLVSFSITSQENKNKICIQCHAGGMQIGWKGSLHRRSGLSCPDCHYTMERKSDRKLLITERATEACFKCHTEKKGQALKSSHMPVREGKMGCESCHSPHGSGNSKMLKAGSVNDLCYSCHAEKRGPFVWEHAPVRENCSNCHDPHGSNNPRMLITKGAFLCLSCHQYGGHVNLPRYNRASSPYGQGCINCHSRIHGSNHPSGAKLTR